MNAARRDGMCRGLGWECVRREVVWWHVMGGCLAVRSLPAPPAGECYPPGVVGTDGQQCTQALRGQYLPVLRIRAAMRALASWRCYALCAGCAMRAHPCAWGIAGTISITKNTAMAVHEYTYGTCKLCKHVIKL